MLVQGSQTVTTAGTPVQLSSSVIICNWVVIQVNRANTGKIFVGDANVDNNGNAGITLEIPVAGQTLPYITLPPIPGSGPNTVDLSAIYLDASVSADKVNFLYDVM